MPEEQWFNPTRVYLTAGAAEGGTPLNGFDNALRAAGITEFNLVGVSSIVPPDADVVTLEDDVGVVRARGRLAPAVYVRKDGVEPGERVAAAVGVGVATAPEGIGMIFVNSCNGSARTAEEGVVAMVEEGMEQTEYAEYEVHTASSSIRVGERPASSIASALFCNPATEKLVEKAR